MKTASTLSVVFAFLAVFGTSSASPILTRRNAEPEPWGNFGYGYGYVPTYPITSWKYRMWNAAPRYNYVPVSYVPYSSGLGPIQQTKVLVTRGMEGHRETHVSQKATVFAKGGDAEGKSRPTVLAANVLVAGNALSTGSKGTKFIPAFGNRLMYEGYSTDELKAPEMEQSFLADKAREAILLHAENVKSRIFRDFENRPFGLASAIGKSGYAYSKSYGRGPTQVQRTRVLLSAPPVVAQAPAKQIQRTMVLLQAPPPPPAPVQHQTTTILEEQPLPAAPPVQEQSTTVLSVAPKVQASAPEQVQDTQLYALPAVAAEAPSEECPSGFEQGLEMEQSAISSKSEGKKCVMVAGDESNIAEKPAEQSNVSEMENPTE